MASFHLFFVNPAAQIENSSKSVIFEQTIVSDQIIHDPKTKVLQLDCLSGSIFCLLMID